MQISAYSFEMKRKMFHLYSLGLPLLYLFTSKTFIVCLLLVVNIITLYLDTSRHYNPKIRNFTNKFFGSLMREGEESGSFRLSSASFMMAGFFLTALLFSKGLAITAWLILIISDCTAAVVGTKIGIPRKNGKSYEGSTAFLVTSILISLLCYSFIGYSTSFFTIIISCTIVTLLEFYSKEINIDDNLLIPLSYATSTCLFRFILGL